jgi:uncharacterized membrane protein YdbT with pleckstrin-like domain
MIVRLVIFELLSGIIYMVIRIGLQYLDIRFDTEFSLSPVALVKSVFFMMAEVTVVGYIVLHWLNTYYVLSSNEVKYITGIITKREMNYSLKNVQSVSFEQGLIGRILNYGSIKIFSPALQKELIMTEVYNPTQIVVTIKKVLNDNSNKAQFFVRR